MPRPRDPARTSPRIGARTGKLALALAIFCAVAGGYVAIGRGREPAWDANGLLADAGERATACTLWFVGSSTVARWQTLRSDFPAWNPRNHGVYGALIPQITHWFATERGGDRPAAIVFYAGENDLAAGVPAAAVLAEFRRFMAAKSARFGDLPVIALSLKPSPARWAQRPAQTTFNDALRREAAVRPDLGYVDIRPLMLAGDRPGPFFIADGLHMNRRGYDRWSSTLRPALARMLPRRIAARCLPDHR